MNQRGLEYSPPNANAYVGKVEACRCPACGMPAKSELLERSNHAELYACPGCDLQFWFPVTMPSADWYEATYQRRDTEELPLEPGHLFFLNDPHAPKKGRLLDVGCGNGNFLAAARDAGFDVMGLEPDQRAIQFAREHYRLKDVFACVPEDFRRDHSRETFDVVTFFEVLEHQKDPQSFLDIAKAFVSENGYIALSVPDRTRWQIGTDTLDYPPNHLTRWSPKALQTFLERNGFEVISIRQQALTARRAAQMFSALFKTGMVSRVAGEKPPVLADLADISIHDVRRKMDQLGHSRRHRLAMWLAGWKSRLLMPAAILLLPLLQMQGYKGVYLYCLVRRRCSSSGSESENTAKAEHGMRL